MVSAIDQRIASTGHIRQVESLRRAKANGQATAAVFDRLEDQLLGLVARNLSQDKMIQRAKELTANAWAKAHTVTERGFKEQVNWAQQATARQIIKATPLGWFKVVHPLLPESWQATLLSSGPESLRLLERIDPLIHVDYEFEPVANWKTDPQMSRDEAMDLIQEILFPPLEADLVIAALSQQTPGGMTWEERFRLYDSQTQESIASMLTETISSGAALPEIRDRVHSVIKGPRYKAQRIARTESGRVAEMANMAAYDQVDDVIDGYQRMEVIDGVTRAHHLGPPINGKIYRKVAPRIYVAADGERRPQLPDEANCRGWLSPLLRIPEELKNDPAVKAAFANDSADLIPDPSSYSSWFSRADEGSRRTAVGVRRYDAVVGRLTGEGRRPEWEDFLDEEGKMVPVGKLKRETVVARNERRQAVAELIAERERLVKEIQLKGAAWPGVNPKPKPPSPSKADVGRAHAKGLRALFDGDQRVAVNKILARLDVVLKDKAAGKEGLKAFGDELGFPLGGTKREMEKQLRDVLGGIHKSEVQVRVIDRIAPTIGRTEPVLRVRTGPSQ